MPATRPPLKKNISRLFKMYSFKTKLYLMDKFNRRPETGKQCNNLQISGIWPRLTVLEWYIYTFLLFPFYRIFIIVFRLSWSSDTWLSDSFSRILRLHSFFITLIRCFASRPLGERERNARGEASHPFACHRRQAGADPEWKEPAPCKGRTHTSTSQRPQRAQYPCQLGTIKVAKD